MTITIEFGGEEIGNVTAVTPSDEFSSEAIVDLASLLGSRTRIRSRRPNPLPSAS